ncbi:MAG: fibrobacter succinogenes major paralogous domain-containing protein [Bacteroidales bacterium]|nr:fibrobacter succinogenes major paralogous domain-containing protein [Bacteroidales bacterium]
MPRPYTFTENSFFFTKKHVLSSYDQKNNAVKIGTQFWTAKNLNVSTFRNGDQIYEAQSAEAWITAGKEERSAWCNYENDPENGKVYGKLYNWYAVNDPRGLAPKGWHVPTDAEWQTLVNYLGGESVAGGKMKETGTEHWRSPNTGATNESEFSGLPGGYRYGTNGNFYYLGSNAFFWSASSYNDYLSWHWYLDYDGSDFHRDSHDIQLGFSVRCVRDH